MSSEANYKFWGNGEKGDVALSYEEYFDVLDSIHDERLGKQMKMHFKNLHEVNSYGLVYIPLYCAPVAFGLTRLILGNAKRGHSGYRPMWTLMSAIWPITCWVGYTTPMPRKLYTNIIADQGPDGTYIRQSLKQTKPGLWRQISRRLYKEKYMFPEMHENTNATEFPTDFVNPHTF